MFFLKGLLVNGLGLVDYEIPGLLVLFCVETIKTPAAGPTVPQFFETGTMKS